MCVCVCVSCHLVEYLCQLCDRTYQIDVDRQFSGSYVKVDGK